MSSTSYRVEEGSLLLQGWHFDLAGGTHSIMDVKSEEFQPAGTASLRVEE